MHWPSLLKKKNIYNIKDWSVSGPVSAVTADS